MRHTEIERKDAYPVKIRVWVGTSRIAGKGLFAAQDIKKGTRIIQYIGQRISKEETAERFHPCLSRRSEYTVTLETEWLSPPVPGAGGD
jgi:SET domain-containing protein